MYQISDKSYFLLKADKVESLKDFSLSAFLKRKPEYSELIHSLIPLLTEKRFLTIDYSYLNLKPNQSTCRDTGWHVDGNGNHYLILSNGLFRTEFSYQEKGRGGLDLRSFNQEISNQNFPFFEIPENTPIIYDSSAIHRGRVAHFEANRTFLRLCMSDYKKPTNKILR